MARKSPSSEERPSPGPAVDASGAPVVDPTANVRALTDAANHRQDDLRVEITRRIDAALEHHETLSNVREQCAKEIAHLREQHTKEFRQLDSDRYDNIRKVDVLNAATAAERALVAIQTLATSQASERDTLRALVATTATAVATQTTQQIQNVATLVNAATERIAALEKSSYEGAGKQIVRDPMQAELFAKMEKVTNLLATGGGKSEGTAAMWGFIVGGVGVVVSVVTAVVVLVKAF